MGKEQGGPSGFQLVGEPADPDVPAGAQSRPGPEALPPITFGAFVLSLSASASFHLDGDPGQKDKGAPPNLPLVKQTIDILEVLRDKTRGNLESEETQLLETVLHELHMRYVEASSAER